MSKYIPGNQKHLSLNERKYIERSLNEGTSFKDIARFLCKDPTTLSKEVKLHRLSDWYHKGTFYNAHNFCVHRYHYQKKNVCGKIILCDIKCTSCPTCDQTCSAFRKERCSRRDNAPYVCNGCPKAINHCTISHKYRYDEIFADLKYRECLSSSKAGINMTKHELHQKDMVITPLIYQGQSPYQIITNHPELDKSVRTLYSYLDDGILTARNIDLKRKVNFKPRKVHKTQIKDHTVFEGRMYTDFQQLGLDHFAEMDTVHSSPESKRVILTDCGSEFGDPGALEAGTTGMIRSSIYYCDPIRSGQKGGIEQAYTMLRMVLPKKTSFKFLTQWDLRTIIDHINSTPRESLGDITTLCTGFFSLLAIIKGLL